jgi:histidine triad (HIT) family protein
MSDCLFCKIVSRQIPSKLVYDDDRLVAIEDINPQAPLHVLIIPKMHIATLNDLTAEHESLIGDRTRARIRRSRLPHGLQHQQGSGPDGLSHSLASARGPTTRLAARVRDL